MELALPGGAEPVRAALAAALPDGAGGIAPVLPDILGEALAITTLETYPDAGVAAVSRAKADKGGPVMASVIRGETVPIRWIEALQADATGLEALAALTGAMPTYTVELREIAHELTQQLLDLARDQSGEADQSLVAGALNNLSIRLAALGRREEALAESEEAVEIWRDVAASIRMHPSTLSRQLRAAGYKICRGPRRRLLTQSQISQAVLERKTINAVARKLQVHWETAKKVLVENRFLSESVAEKGAPYSISAAPFDTS